MLRSLPAAQLVNDLGGGGELNPAIRLTLLPTINATGSFKGGQPSMRLTQNGANQQYVAGNYDNGTASFDITGVVKGTYTVRDGPMLQHGIKEMEGRTIVTPGRAANRPRIEYLAERFESFGAA